MLYTINPESNQVVCDTPEEAAEYTGIEINRIMEMKPGDMITDGTECGCKPADFEIVCE